MKLKDTFMSSPICVKILKYQCIPKNFPLLCRQLFSIHNLETDNFFSQLQLANNLFYEKGNPSIKNNGPPLMSSPLPHPGLKMVHHFFLIEAGPRAKLSCCLQVKKIWWLVFIWNLNLLQLDKVPFQDI